MRPAIFFLLLALSSTGWAWSEGTHRLIADIVWLEMTPAQRSTAYQWLLAHPDYENGFRRFMPADLPTHEQPRWVFRQAAAWPDLARDYRDTDPKRYRRFNHSTWHYVNFPLWLDADSQQQYADQLTANRSLNPDDGPAIHWNAPQAVAYNLARLGDDSTPTAERAVALSWLLHVVADLHQPMHTVAIFGLPNMETTGDRGGNSICVTGQGQANNMHWLWDSALFNGENIAVLERWSLRVVANEYNNLSDPVSLSIADWIEEGISTASNTVYPESVRQQIRNRIDGGDCDNPTTGRIAIDDDYMRTARQIAQKRVMLAARRLARLVDRPLRSAD